MPPRKKREDKQQPKLVEWMGNQQNMANMSRENRQELLDKEIGKLLKVRREIESRQQQQQRILKRIIRLQIDEDRQYIETDVIEPKEEYLILTLQQSMLGVQSPSMFKLCLCDYGEIFVNQDNTNYSVDQQQKIGQDKQFECKIGAQTQTSVKQWTENGNLSPEFLNDYSNNFLEYLQQIQYNANALQQTRSVL